MKILNKKEFNLIKWVIRGFKMGGKIYMIQDDSELVEMEEKEYEREIILQKLIADYPNLLAGEQMDADNPRRWLLISREMGIAFEEEGSRFLSLDHLFLDQDGIPTLVEVKRSSDTRLRREVIGQMLDYAANAVVYLPTEEIREKIESQYDLALQEDFLDNAENEEKFWQSVKTNLQAGKVRMVFVADKIPNELKRIIEFLNEQMDPAEVLAVEIKQYVDINGKVKTLVPRVIGQTSEAQMKKESKVRNPLLNQKTFFENLDNNGKEFFDVLFNFARKEELVTRWGTKGFSLNIDIEGNMVSLMQGYSSLSAYGQVIFSKVDSIQRKVRDSDKILEEYMAVLELDNFEKVGNGFRLDVSHKLDEKLLKRFKEILSNVICDIKENGLK